MSSQPDRLKVPSASAVRCPYRRTFFAAFTSRLSIAPQSSQVHSLFPIAVIPLCLEEGVSNQSGIGRGYFDEKAHADLTRWMCNRFEAERAAIARVYHCPYHPLHGIGEYRREHPWRKPNPGMILQAIFDFRLDPARCAIVGDKMSDIEAGAAAGLGLRNSCRIPALPKRGAAFPTP